MIVDVCLLRKSVIIAIVYMWASAGHGGEWYESFQFRVKDPFGIGPYHSAPDVGGIRLIHGWKKAGWRNVSQGEVYLILSKEELAEFEKPDKKKHPGGVYTYERVPLTGETARFWREHFAKQAKSDRVPILLSLAGLASGVYGKAFTVSSTFSDYLLGQGDTRTESAARLSEVMAKGGEFVEYVTIVRDKSRHPVLHSNLFYQVKVGEESRNYLVYSTVYAVKVE